MPGTVSLLKHVIQPLLMLAATFLIGVIVSFGWQIRDVIALMVSNPESRSLGVNVLHAKLRGMKEYKTVSIICGTNLPTLDEAVSDYSVLVAEPIAKEVYVDGRGLATLYKFKIIKTLASRPMPPGGFADAAANSELPRGVAGREIAPPGSDEFLMERMGGSLKLGGIAVHHYTNEPDFSLAKKYLLFVSMDKQGRAHVPWAHGQRGIFIVEDDQIVQAWNDDEANGLSERLRSEMGNSLSKLATECLHRTLPH